MSNLKIIIEGPAKSGKTSLAFEIEKLLASAGIEVGYADPDGANPGFYIPIGVAVKGPVAIETVQARRESLMIDGPTNAAIWDRYVSKIRDENGGVWGEHDDFPVSDWRYEVANQDTRTGYWEWVAARVEQAVLEASQAGG